MRSRPALRGITIVPTWTEDRAMLGSNPSAVPGAHTEGGRPQRAPRNLSQPFRDEHQCVKPTLASHATVYLSTSAVSFTPNQHRVQS